MDDATMRRIGGNEAAFRKVNESLRAGRRLADAERLFPFRCECGVLGCNQLIELTVPEYEELRLDPTRFAIIEGHDIPGSEDVVERRGRYVVVEKFGPGAEVAKETDPRA